MIMRSDSEIKRGIELLEEGLSNMEQSGNPEEYKEEIAHTKGKIKALEWVIGKALL
jgi:hypothetical protein